MGERLLKKCVGPFPAQVAQDNGVHAAGRGRAGGAPCQGELPQILQRLTRHERCYPLGTGVRQPGCAGERSGEDFIGCHVQAVAGEAFADETPAAAGGVGDATERNAGASQRCQHLGRTGNGGIALIERAVQIETPCPGSSHVRVLPVVAVILAGSLTHPLADWPFAVGETLHYEARLGYFPAGTADLHVARTTSVRGKPAVIFTLNAAGGPPGFKSSWDLTSWVESSRFASL